MRAYRASRADRKALTCMLLDHLAAAAPSESGKPGRFVSVEGERAESYQLAILDVLTALGIVEQSNDGLSARPISPFAGSALRILCDIFEHGSSQGHAQLICPQIIPAAHPAGLESKL